MAQVAAKTLAMVGVLSAVLQHTPEPGPYPRTTRHHDRRRHYGRRRHTEDTSAGGGQRQPIGSYPAAAARRPLRPLSPATIRVWAMRGGGARSALRDGESGHENNWSTADENDHASFPQDTDSLQRSELIERLESQYATAENRGDGSSSFDTDGIGEQSNRGDVDIVSHGIVINELEASASEERFLMECSRQRRRRLQFLFRAKADELDDDTGDEYRHDRRGEGLEDGTRENISNDCDTSEDTEDSDSVVVLQERLENAQRLREKAYTHFKLEQYKRSARQFDIASGWLSRGNVIRTLDSLKRKCEVSYQENENERRKEHLLSNNTDLYLVLRLNAAFAYLKYHQSQKTRIGDRFGQLCIEKCMDVVSLLKPVVDTVDKENFSPQQRRRLLRFRSQLQQAYHRQSQAYLELLDKQVDKSIECCRHAIRINDTTELRALLQSASEFKSILEMGESVANMTITKDESPKTRTDQENLDVDFTKPQSTVFSGSFKPRNIFGFATENHEYRDYSVGGDGDSNVGNIRDNSCGSNANHTKKLKDELKMSAFTNEEFISG